MMNHLILLHVNILNNQPITMPPEDSSHLEAVTLNNIILMKNPKGLPPGIFTDSDNCVRRIWRQIGTAVMDHKRFAITGQCLVLGDL